MEVFPRRLRVPVQRNLEVRLDVLVVRGDRRRVAPVRRALQTVQCVQILPAIVPNLHGLPVQLTEGPVAVGGPVVAAQVSLEKPVKVRDAPPRDRVPNHPRARAQSRF